MILFYFILAVTQKCFSGSRLVRFVGRPVPSVSFSSSGSPERMSCVCMKMKLFSCLDLLGLRVPLGHAIKAGVKGLDVCPRLISSPTSMLVRSRLGAAHPLPSLPEGTKMKNVSITLYIPMSSLDTSLAPVLFSSLQPLLRSWVLTTGAGWGPGEGQTRAVLGYTHPCY